MSVIIIAAISKNNVIGKDNKIPWHIKDDFKHFKELTLNNSIIMGRKTFESLPIKPLPKRQNVVVTRDESFNYPDVIVKNNLDSAIDFCKDKSCDIYIIGGSQIYSQTLDICDKLELTIIDKEYQGDTFFPEIDFNKWNLVNEEKKEGYSFLTYTRK